MVCSPTPTGASLAPSGTALLWADPAAASGDAAAAAVAAAAGSIPQAVWGELGALPNQGSQPGGRFSPRLQLSAWRFLDRLHSSGAAAAAAAEASSPPSPVAQLLRLPTIGGSSGQAGSRPASPAAGETASLPAASTGLSHQTLLRLQQQRGLLLLQRLLLHALLHAPPEQAQQAASQCGQLLPALLADAAAETAAAEAAAARLQLLLAAVVQVYRSVAARAQQAQQDQLLPLQLQQRLTACEAAANAIVDAAPWVFGLRTAAEQQQQQQQQPRPGQAPAKPRLIQELLPLLQPRAVVSAAQQQLLFMRHCCALHEGAVALLQQQLSEAATQEAQLVGAAEEGSRQCLGRLLAADRLRRAAGRQAADEAAQLLERRWRDLARALKSGRGLWADEERAEGELWVRDVMGVGMHAHQLHLLCAAHAAACVCANRFDWFAK